MIFFGVESRTRCSRSWSQETNDDSTLWVLACGTARSVVFRIDRISPVDVDDVVVVMLYLHSGPSWGVSCKLILPLFFCFVAIKLVLKSSPENGGRNTQKT